MTKSPSLSGRTRLLRWLLPASLALNLLFVAGILGALLTGPEPRDRPHRARDGAGLLLSALEREDRRALGAAMRTAGYGRGAGEGRRNARDAALFRFADLLAAPDFDHIEAEAALETLDQRDAARRMAGRTALIAHLAAMPRERRLAYAQRLEGMLETRAGGTGQR